MTYTDLSDEDKIRQSVAFVAQGQPLPEALIKFLEEVGLHDAIVNPMVIEHEQYQAQ